MSKLELYKRALHNYTLITPTLAAWSALYFTIISLIDEGNMIRWILLILGSILIMSTVICAKQWYRLFHVYNKVLLRKRSKNEYHDD